MEKTQLEKLLLESPKIMDNLMTTQINTTKEMAEAMLIKNKVEMKVKIDIGNELDASGKKKFANVAQREGELSKRIGENSEWVAINERTKKLKEDIDFNKKDIEVVTMNFRALNSIALLSYNIEDAVMRAINKLTEIKDRKENA